MAHFLNEFIKQGIPLNLFRCFLVRIEDTAVVALGGIDEVRYFFRTKNGGAGDSADPASEGPPPQAPNRA